MSRRILVAEDDPFNQMVIQDMLEIVAPGAACTVVSDGNEALAQLREGTWDLVLSDIDMPGLDGNELLRRVRDDLGLDVPMVSVTAFAVVGDRERLLMHGFDDYISKPIDLDRMAEVVGRYLGRTAPVGGVSR